ncbi:hypothetical protein DWV16_06605 [Anaerotruncus sp. AF02-27]|nr:hypothetical protein DWV16_06605 [Anaerotruncus sp. AF02-27]
MMQCQVFVLAFAYCVFSVYKMLLIFTQYRPILHSKNNFPNPLKLPFQAVLSHKKTVSKALSSETVLAEMERFELSRSF